MTRLSGLGWVKKWRVGRGRRFSGSCWIEKIRVGRGRRLVLEERGGNLAWLE